jgi:hypothetical protein
VRPHLFEMQFETAILLRRLQQPDLKSILMRYLAIAAVLFLFIFACTNKRELVIQEHEADTQEDSVTYELIVLDPGFESWFLIHATPAKNHTQSYYEGWNQRYVNAWNYQHVGYRYAQVIEGNIDYYPDIDYGFELNHKLFYYFMYVENELGIQLIPDGPKSF